MIPAALATPVTAPADPVQAALADEDILTKLRVHARSIIGRWLKDRCLA